jgi:hypothetical protein
MNLGVLITRYGQTSIEAARVYPKLQQDDLLLLRGEFK